MIEIVPRFKKLEKSDVETWIFASVMTLMLALALGALVTHVAVDHVFGLLIDNREHGLRLCRKIWNEDYPVWTGAVALMLLNSWALRVLLGAIADLQRRRNES